MAKDKDKGKEVQPLLEAKDVAKAKDVAEAKDAPASQLGNKEDPLLNSKV